MCTDLVMNAYTRYCVKCFVVSKGCAWCSWVLWWVSCHLHEEPEAQRRSSALSKVAQTFMEVLGFCDDSWPLPSCCPLSQRRLGLRLSLVLLTTDTSLAWAPFCQQVFLLWGDAAATGDCKCPKFCLHFLFGQNKPESQELLLWLRRPETPMERVPFYESSSEVGF